MTDRGYDRGAVVKGPDLFADNEFRPYVCLSDDSPPFRDEEAVYTAVTTTSRPDAVPLSNSDFAVGSLPKQSYVNPWTLVTVRHADIDKQEAQLTAETTELIAERAATHLGVKP
jgi:mRNA-degrading endonuclease toxin of MazEF toxin-antitoxin module